MCRPSIFCAANYTREIFLLKKAGELNRKADQNEHYFPNNPHNNDNICISFRNRPSKYNTIHLFIVLYFNNSYCNNPREFMQF